MTRFKFLWTQLKKLHASCAFLYFLNLIQSNNDKLYIMFLLLNFMLYFYYNTKFIKLYIAFIYETIIQCIPVNYA